MKPKVMQHDGVRTFTVVFETGQEVLAGIAEFARAEGIVAAHFSGLGACERAALAYWDLDSREYQRIAVDEQVEVLSLLGNIALGDNEDVRVHAHMVIGKRAGGAHGGHLLEAHVRPTLELVVHASTQPLRRSKDEVTGLYLLDL
jgi:uncharacterized protein